MIAKMNEWLSALRRDERGLTTVEYAIVLCLIAAMAVGVWNQFGGMVKEKLNESKDEIDTQMDTSEFG